MFVYSHVDVGDGEVDPEPGVAQPARGEHVLALVGEGEAAACPARRPEVSGHVARELHAAAGRHGLLGLPHHHLRRARQVLHVCKQKHHYFTRSDPSEEFSTLFLTGSRLSVDKVI